MSAVILTLKYYFQEANIKITKLIVLPQHYSWIKNYYNHLLFYRKVVEFAQTH